MNRCLCGIALPAADHPVSEVIGFTMIECPSAPKDELWMFNPEYVREYPPRSGQVARIKNLGSTEPRSGDA